MLEGAAADEDGEVVAAAVGKGEPSADAFAADAGGELDGVADAFLAGGVADVDSAIVAGFETLAGVEGAFGSEKCELKFPAGRHAEVAGPDGGIGGTSVGFGGDGLDTGNLDIRAVADDRERGGRFGAGF